MNTFDSRRAPAEHQAFQERRWEQQEKQDDDRDVYDHDKGRVIHSFAFRRLQNKTQVSAPGEGDFHRTRLTHSLEVGQIGEGILNLLRRRLSAPARNLAHWRLDSAQRQEALEWLPRNDLIITACYCHDLGHPPFGHAGEEALHRCLHTFFDKATEAKARQAEREHGGFESNAHTLRIVTRLEPYFTAEGRTGGMNLTRRALLAILKYPVSYAQYPPSAKAEQVVKCYFQSEREYVRWAAEAFPPNDRALYTHAAEITEAAAKARCYPTLDATIMDLADEIAYSTHDVEDNIFLKRLSRDDIVEARENMKQELDENEARELQRILTDKRIEWLFRTESGAGNNAGDDAGNNAGDEAGDDARRKRIISGLIHNFITSATIETRAEFQHPLLKYRVALPKVQGVLLKHLRKVVWDKVINSPHRRIIDNRNQCMIQGLFAVYYDNCENLRGYPAQLQRAMEVIGNETGNETAAKLRVITDHIAGMSDESLMKDSHELFGS